MGRQEGEGRLLRAFQLISRDQMLIKSQATREVMAGCGPFHPSIERLDIRTTPTLLIRLAPITPNFLSPHGQSKLGVLMVHLGRPLSNGLR